MPARGGGPSDRTAFKEKSGGELGGKVQAASNCARETAPLRWCEYDAGPIRNYYARNAARSEP